MATQTKTEIQITIENEQPITTSRNVAENFDKNHRDVLRDIRNLTAQNSAMKNMFFETTYKNSRGQEHPEVLMNRDGFTLLAMGFTGKRALEFKLAYIERFNEMERQLQNQLPGTYKEALIQLVEQVEQNELLEYKIAEYEPKVNYLDTILSSTDTVTITQIAADYGMSARAMNKLLNELGVQHKVGGQWILYKKHMQQGYTKSHTNEIQKADGGVKVVMNTKWTQKGKLFLYNLLKEEGYLPQMELELQEA